MIKKPRKLSMAVTGPATSFCNAYRKPQQQQQQQQHDGEAPARPCLYWL
jgi:hypothetical protein